MRTAAIARIAFLVTLILVVAALLVPNSALNFLRGEYAWLGAFANGVDRLHLGVDLDHVIAFAVLGCTAGAALRRTGIVTLVFGAALLAAASEIAQFWIPGRTPRLSDAAVDVAGAALGLLAARLAIARTTGIRDASTNRRTGRSEGPLEEATCTQQTLRGDPPTPESRWRNWRREGTTTST